MQPGNIRYASNYNVKEYFLRSLWSLARPFFRFSPRLLYGWRNLILRLFGARIGKSVKIYPSADIMFPWNLEIGDRTVISWQVIVYNPGIITIGSDTVISQYSHLCAGNHDYSDPGFRLLKTPVSVGSGVWIAADVFIAPGVSIGDRCIIYARSVVVRDIPDDSIAAGHPAKVVKQR